MRLDPKFQAASDAAEGWLNTVAMVVHLAQGGNIDMAMMLLMPTENEPGANLQDSYNEHAETLSRMNDQMAALSDGPVKWDHGRGLSAIARCPNSVYPHVWSSAHEAAAGISRLALYLLVWPLAPITDPAKQWTGAKRLLTNRWKALTVSIDEVATLQERIKRERARLMKNAESESETAKPRTGRRKKEETNMDEIVLAAFVRYHGYENGTVTNREPAKVRELPDTCKEKGKKIITTAAISRFLSKRLKGGHAEYCRLCGQGLIAEYLVKWSGETPNRQPRLRENDPAPPMTYASYGGDEENEEA